MSEEELELERLANAAEDEFPIEPEEDETPKLLKPCPFCGGEAKVSGGNSIFWTECPKTKCMAAPSFNTPEAAAEWWNTRHVPDTIAFTARICGDEYGMYFCVPPEQAQALVPTAIFQPCRHHPDCVLLYPHQLWTGTEMYRFEISATILEENQP